MKFLLFFFYLYIVTQHTSLAGMEMTVWLVILPSLYFSFKQKKFLWPSKIVIISLLGLLASALISFFINIDKASGFIDYIGEFRWIMIYLFLIQFFNIAYQHINFQKMILVGQSVLIVAGVYSYYQFFAGHDFFRNHVVFHYIYDGSKYFRPNSFFGLPTTYGYASGMFLSLALAFWMREKRAEKNWIHNIRRLYFVVAPSNIFLTFTRAAWIASMTSTQTILWQTNRRYFFRAGLACIILMGGLYTSFPSFTNRVNSVFDSNYVANENRIYLWKANWNIFKENPLFGLGFDENRKQIDTYLKPFNKPFVMRNHPHNTYLNFLAGLGIFGFGFFMLFLVYNLKTCITGFYHSTNSMHKTLFLGILGLQMVLLIGAMTECNFEDLELCHQYILFVALAEYLKLNFGNLSLKKL